MKFTQDFSTITQQNTNLKEEKAQFYQNFQNLFQGNKDSYYSEQKTSHYDGIISGVWRKNKLLEDSQKEYQDQTLSLRHITSFEQRGMEDHGNSLKNTLKNYLKFIQKQICPQSEGLNQKHTSYILWEQIEEAISLNPYISQGKKFYIINFCKRNTSGQLILKQMFNLISSSQLPYCLIIIQQLIEEYVYSHVLMMDENEIEIYVSINFQKTAVNIKKEFHGTGLFPINTQYGYEYQQMVATWMETIFLALNGVFENPSKRESTLYAHGNFSTLNTTKKLVKTD